MDFLWKGILPNKMLLGTGAPGARAPPAQGAAQSTGPGGAGSLSPGGRGPPFPRGKKPKKGGKRTVGEKDPVDQGKRTVPATTVTSMKNWGPSKFVSLPEEETGAGVWNPS